MNHGAGHIVILVHCAAHVISLYSIIVMIMFHQNRELILYFKKNCKVLYKPVEELRGNCSESCDVLNGLFSQIFSLIFIMKFIIDNHGQSLYLFTYSQSHIHGASWSLFIHFLTFSIHVS